MCELTVDFVFAREEAEFFALTKSALRDLGAIVMAADMAKVVNPRVRGTPQRRKRLIASGRGWGKWGISIVQEAVPRRELTIVKMPGIENPADKGTQHLAQRENARMLEESKLPHHQRAVRVAQGTRVICFREHRLRLTNVVRTDIQNSRVRNVERSRVLKIMEHSSLALRRGE